MAFLDTPISGESAVYDPDEGKQTQNEVTEDVAGWIFDPMGQTQALEPGTIDWEQYDPTAPDYQGSDYYTQQIQGGIAGAQERAGQAPTMDPASMEAANAVAAGGYGGAVIDPSLQAAVRAGQENLAGVLGQRVAGQAPSVAEMQMTRGREADIRAAQALAVGSTNPAAALKGSMGAISDMRIQGNLDAAMLRAGEQATAEGRLGGHLAGMRGADIGLATGQAGFDQQAGIQEAGFRQQATMANAQMTQDAAKTNAQLIHQANQANLQTEVQWQQMSDTLIQNMINSGMSMSDSQQQAAIQIEQIKADQAKAELEKETTELEAEEASKSGIIGAVGSLLTSDIRAKKNIQDGKGDVREFMDSIAPYTYDYKNGEGDGMTGVMAQDMERSRLGRDMVSENGEGTKQIDGNRAIQATLAANADLNQRVKQLEGQLTGAGYDRDFDVIHETQAPFPGQVIVDLKDQGYYVPGYGTQAGSPVELEEGVDLRELQKFLAEGSGQQPSGTMADWSKAIENQTVARR